MKLLEHLGKKQRNLIVQRKAKTKKKTSKSILYLICSSVLHYFLFLCYLLLFLESSKTPAQNTSEDNDTMWTNISPDLTNIIQMSELVVNAIEARPYDPVSDVPMEEQK